MPTTYPPAAYLVIDGCSIVIGRAMRLQQAEALEVEARQADPTLVDIGTEVVDLYTTDVKTLAQVAVADNPRLAETGRGVLGAGTNPAQPYLEAMLHMPGVTRDNVKTVRWGYDNADHVVRYFLENVSTWRGDTARDVKAALRSMIA